MESAYSRRRAGYGESAAVMRDPSALLREAAFPTKATTIGLLPNSAEDVSTTMRGRRPRSTKTTEGSRYVTR